MQDERSPKDIASGTKVQGTRDSSDMRYTLVEGSEDRCISVITMVENNVIVDR